MPPTESTESSLRIDRWRRSYVAVHAFSVGWRPRNPLEDVRVIHDYEKSNRLIMKLD